MDPVQRLVLECSSPISTSYLPWIASPSLKQRFGGFPILLLRPFLRVFYPPFFKGLLKGSLSFFKALFKDSYPFLKESLSSPAFHFFLKGNSMRGYDLLIGMGMHGIFEQEFLGSVWGLKP